MKVVKVVCGIIWKEGRVFIAKRKPEKSMGGYWEFPGGKIEVGEDVEIALIRELNEELGMQVKVKSYFGKNVHQYDSFTIELIAYACDFVSATFNLTDHDDFKFLTVHEIKQLKLAPADVYFINML